MGLRGRYHNVRGLAICCFELGRYGGGQPRRWVKVFAQPWLEQRDGRFRMGRPKAASEDDVPPGVVIADLFRVCLAIVSALSVGE
jgi:hypothetical protein